MYVKICLQKCNFSGLLKNRVGVENFGVENRFFQKVLQNHVFHDFCSKITFFGGPDPKNVVFARKITFLRVPPKNHGFSADAERRGYYPLRPSSMTPVNQWSIGGDPVSRQVFSGAPQNHVFSGPEAKKRVFAYFFKKPGFSGSIRASCAPKIIFQKIPIFKMLFRQWFYLYCLMVLFIMCFEMSSQRSGASLTLLLTIPKSYPYKS